MREGELAAAAERLLAAPRVRLSDLALNFEESRGVLRRGARRRDELLPPDARRHRAGDLLDPHNPVRLPARSRRRPLRRGARREGEGSCPGSHRRRPQRLEAEEESQEFYERLPQAGARSAATARPSCDAVRPAGVGRSVRWNLDSLGHIDHRKMIVVDGRIGWIGGAGIEDHSRRPLPRPLPAARGAGRVAAAARVPRQPALARRLGACGRRRCLLPRRAAADDVPARVLHNAPSLPPITEAIDASSMGPQTLDVGDPT